MAADSKYVVELDLRKVGDFGLQEAEKKTAGLERATDRLSKAWDRLADSGAVQRLGGAVDWANGKMASFARTAALVGGVTLFAGATYGVTQLNNELEQAELSLGAIFKAQGVTSTVPSGVILARDVIADMREDAKRLPGEFQDLLSIFRLGATPALQSGLDPDEWRNLAAQAMAAAKAVGTPLDQAARELTLLLEGRAGAQNTFGTKLGLTGSEAEKFNQLDPAKRVERLRVELGKYKEAIDVYGESYDAISSTFADNVKTFGRLATNPLFERVKDTLSDLNTWFDANQGTVEAWADHLGVRLEGAFDWGRQKVEEWGPLVINFASTAYDRFIAIWHDVEPAVQRIAELIKEALADPNGSLDKLILLASLSAGSGLLGGAVGGKGGTVIKAGGALAMAGQVSGNDWGALGGNIVGGATVGSQFGGVRGAVAGALVGLFGSVYQMRGQRDDAWSNAYGSYYDGKARQIEDMGEAYAAQERYMLEQEAVAELVRQQEHLGYVQEDYAEQLLRMKSELTAGVDEYSIASSMAAEAVDALRASGDEAGASLLELAFAAREANFAVHRLGGRIVEQIAERANMDMGLVNASLALKGAASLYGDQVKAAKTKPKHRGGGGGTTVQKVEIVVTSNQNPSRIAREVKDKFAQWTRTATSSPDVVSYAEVE